MFLGHHQTKIQKLSEGRFRKRENFNNISWKNQCRSEFFMQYLNTHSFEITPILKTGYSNDQQKLYRIQNPKLGKIVLTKLLKWSANILTNGLVL